MTLPNSKQRRGWGILDVLTGRTELNSSLTTLTDATTSIAMDAPLTPVPVPDFATLPDANVWDFLNVIDPIDGFDLMALHVAQLTMGLSEIKRRLERLENERSE
jgi:hypothetical protein